MRFSLQPSQWDKKWIYAALAIVFALFSRVCGVTPLFAFVMMLWGGLVLYTLHDLRNRAGYLVFLLAFFLFLLGGEFFEQYFGYPQEYQFEERLDLHAYVVLLVSLGFLQVGYVGADVVLGKRKKKEQPKLRRRDAPERLQQLQKFSKVFLYITAVPLFLQTLDTVLFTMENGYLSYYTTYSSRLPGLVGVAGELFTMFFFLYLATFPAKKACLLPMGIYLAHGVLAMLTGRRISLGVAVLVILFYVLLRHGRNKEEKWINRKIVIGVAILCPVMILVLHMQRYLRYGESVKGGNVIDMVCSFLSQQGSSINILKFQKQMEGDGLGCTSLYYTLHYLRGNVITRHFFDFPLEYYATRSVETALHTNCLADYIMFQVNVNDFFMGYGLGTSYIAELNHDLGLLGVALGGAIYGFLLNWLYSPKYFSYWKFALGLMMLEEFVIMPRYGADVILRPFYNLTKMAVLIGIFVLVLLGREGIQKILEKTGLDKPLRKLLPGAVKNGRANDETEK